MEGSFIIKFFNQKQDFKNLKMKFIQQAFKGNNKWWAYLITLSFVTFPFLSIISSLILKSFFLDKKISLLIQKFLRQHKPKK